MSSKETILNIPTVGTPTGGPPHQPAPPPASDSSHHGADDHTDDDFGEDGEEGIGEFDDGRSGKLTLSVLLQEGLITPAEGVMSIDYLGQTFKGDLLQSGKIKSLETGLIFNNPSAWAIYCKQIVNPAKKSGCGWASVKYKGRKMDYYKSLWLKMKSQREKNLAAAGAQQLQGAQDGVGGQLGHHSDPNDHHGQHEEKGHPAPNDNYANDPIILSRPAILKHCQLAPKHPMDNLTTLIEVETFQSQGKIQPFNISISSSALLLIDLHSHLNLDCVCGYLAGQWDLSSHNLAITHVFPCLTDLKDPVCAEKTESRIYNEIYSRNLSLVGWYRSCPGLRALPSLKDTEAQLDHQMKLLGPTDATYSPCVGLLVSPYTSGSSESEMLVYWVVPPPESSPGEYGKPSKMIYTMITDPCLSQEVLTTIEDLISFYHQHPRVVAFQDQFNSDTKFITKMGRTLLPKFPRDQDERLWRYIRILILGAEAAEVEDPLMMRPPISAATSSGHFDGDEDEIDDDEENALNLNKSNKRPGSRPSISGTPENTSNPVSTEQVISMLLQQQAPVAPPAHQSSKTSSAFTSAPLDFSKPDAAKFM